MDKINSQEVLKLKESVADAILMRIFGGKLANDNAELPVRTSFFNTSIFLLCSRAKFILSITTKLLHLDVILCRHCVISDSA